MAVTKKTRTVNVHKICYIFYDKYLGSYVYMYSLLDIFLLSEFC